MYYTNSNKLNAPIVPITKALTLIGKGFIMCTMYIYAIHIYINIACILIDLIVTFKKAYLTVQQCRGGKKNEKT